MTLALVGDTANVVLKGPFNPGIFSPSWLFANGVIGAAEYNESAVEFITADVARFKCGWLSTTVTQGALQLETKDVDEFERLRDAVVAILNLLPHVPLGVMGINRSAHFEVGGVDAWHKVGDTLAPKSVWEPVLTLPGMKSVTLWGVRPDSHAGRIQVTVEPSSMIQLGVFVAHNDHFELIDVAEQPTSRDDESFRRAGTRVEPDLDKRLMALAILERDWVISFDRARKVMDNIFSIASEA